MQTLTSPPRLSWVSAHRNIPMQRKTRPQFIIKSLTHRTTIPYLVITQSDVGPSLFLLFFYQSTFIGQPLPLLSLAWRLIRAQTYCGWVILNQYCTLAKFLMCEGCPGKFPPAPPPLPTRFSTLHSHINFRSPPRIYDLSNRSAFALKLQGVP